MLAVAEMPNPCAGPFGALYDFYIEREWLAAIVGRLWWGIDVRPFYASMKVIGEQAAGATILDAPSGGGVALRGLHRDQNVRYIAVDLSPQMLARVVRRAEKRALHQVEIAEADICQLPFDDDLADLCLSYSGLHAVPDPQQATHELVRCLKPGGQLVGTTFLRQGSRRQKYFFEFGRLRGFPAPSFSSQELRSWLTDTGLTGVRVDPDCGFALFSGRKRDSPKSVTD